MSITIEDKTPNHKLKIEFEGWHRLSKRQMKTILSQARHRFQNANFIDNSGLIIEDLDVRGVFIFIHSVVEHYSGFLGNWDGYQINKISRQILYNFLDKKRKLSISYFEKLVKNSSFKDSVPIIAGMLYLKPTQVKNIILNLENEFGAVFDHMSDEQIRNLYRSLLMFAARKERRL